MTPSRLLSILYVAYPLLTVSEQSAGGAEQLLWTLEREIARAGHRTTVAASDGSQVTGRILATGASVSAPDHYEQREREHCNRVLAYLHKHPREIDIIHDESGSFWRHAAECSVPVLATLHLPRTFYPEDCFRAVPKNLSFNCVSRSQGRTFGDLPNLLGVVENGIEIDRYSPNQHGGARSNSGYVLWLGRICEEKAPHLAIEVARRANMPLVLAGQVYPFSYHQQYFEREIKPQLSDGQVQFVKSPTFAEKLDLLRNAQAVLLASTAEETSSLVAIEAMACGTPVVAFRRGAFPEIVANGETGFIVDSTEEMAEALMRIDQISPAACRARAEAHFSSDRMGREYESMYAKLLEDIGKTRAA